MKMSTKFSLKRISILHLFIGLVIVGAERITVSPNWGEGTLQSGEEIGKDRWFSNMKIYKGRETSIWKTIPINDNRLNTEITIIEKINGGIPFGKPKFPTSRLFGSAMVSQEKKKIFMKYIMMGN